MGSTTMTIAITTADQAVSIPFSLQRTLPDANRLLDGRAPPTLPQTSL
jgi:hypothetical protein